MRKENTASEYMYAQQFGIKSSQNIQNWRIKLDAYFSYMCNLQYLHWAPTRSNNFDTFYSLQTGRK